MPPRKLCLYEFTASGGFAESWEALAPEGMAMFRALADDLSRAGFAVTALLDERYASSWPALPGVEIAVVPRGLERTRLAEHAPRADWTIAIAPETGGLLEERRAWVVAAGGRWAGCGAETLALAADKHRMAELLRSRGVAAPRGKRVAHGEPVDCRYPAVLKPIDGAGSSGVLCCDAPQSPEVWQAAVGSAIWRLEEFIEGEPASATAICGPGVRLLLPPCWQTIRRTAEGGLSYEGGRLPLPPRLEQRATRLAVAAIDALPDPLGFVGVDMILGSDPEGGGDVVLEINPRMTTSYVGLRAACQGNLAAALVSALEGKAHELTFHSAALRFDAQGNIYPESWP